MTGPVRHRELHADRAVVPQGHVVDDELGVELVRFRRDLHLGEVSVYGVPQPEEVRAQAADRQLGPVLLGQLDELPAAVVDFFGETFLFEILLLRGVLAHDVQQVRRVTQQPVLERGRVTLLDAVQGALLLAERAQVTGLRVEKVEVLVGLLGAPFQYVDRRLPGIDEVLLVAPGLRDLDTDVLAQPVENLRT